MKPSYFIYARKIYVRKYARDNDGTVGGFPPTSNFYVRVHARKKQGALRLISMDAFLRTHVNASKLK